MKKKNTMQVVNYPSLDGGGGGGEGEMAGVGSLVVFQPSMVFTLHHNHGQ